MTVLLPSSVSLTVSPADPVIDVVVRRKTVEAEGINSYELQSKNGSKLPGFSAGAHIRVFLENGLTRQYSLCHPSSDPASYIIAVNREAQSRGGSVHIHQHWRPDSAVRISHPANHFPLVEGAPALLFAAGIGVTPILAMSEELSARGTAFDLHYAARLPDNAAFADYLTRSKYAGNVHLYFSRSPASRRMDARPLLARSSIDRHIYVCGPERFIKAVLDEATAQGWTSGKLHREFFTRTESAAAPAGSFILELAKSGKTLEVGSDQTVLAALADAGVEVPSSCEVGVCGTCVTRVIDGIPDHQDSFLTDEEHARNDCFTPCCSRAKTPKLVVDL